MGVSACNIRGVLCTSTHTQHRQGEKKEKKESRVLVHVMSSDWFLRAIGLLCFEMEISLVSRVGFQFHFKTSCVYKQRE